MFRHLPKEHLQRHDTCVDFYLTGVLLSLPWKKFNRIFFLQKSVLMGLNFIPQKNRVVIGSSCCRFLQPKNAKLFYKGSLRPKPGKTGKLASL